VARADSNRLTCPACAHPEMRVRVTDVSVGSGAVFQEDDHIVLPLRSGDSTFTEVVISCAKCGWARPVSNWRFS
jgi:hypothetical protein